MSYVIREYSPTVWKKLDDLGFPAERIEEIWYTESVPDVYKVNGSVVVDLQFLDHRVMVAVTKDTVLVVHEGNPRTIQWLKKVLRKKRKFLEDSRQFLFHIVMTELRYLNEYAVDIHKEITRMERLLLSGKENLDVVKLYGIITILLDLKRDLSYFLRVTGKLRGVLSDTQVKEIVYTIREVLSMVSLSISTARSMLDVHDKMLSMELNLLIKRLTAISIILAVITIITGIYGMNFRYLPLSEHPLGFWILNGFMVAVFVLLWWWFRRIGWM